MAKNVTLMGATYSDVPRVDLPQTGGGTASFYEVSDADITASDVVSGKVGYGLSGKVTGTVVIQKYYTGTSTPSSSLGNNGDLYFKT